MFTWKMFFVSISVKDSKYLHSAGQTHRHTHTVKNIPLPMGL